MIYFLELSGMQSHRKDLCFFKLTKFAQMLCN